MLGKGAHLPLPLPQSLNSSIHLIHRWNPPAHTHLSLFRTSTVPTITHQIHTAWQTKTWFESLLHHSLVMSSDEHWASPSLLGCITAPGGDWDENQRQMCKSTQYIPLQCSLWRSLITLLHTHCQSGLSRCSMEARVGRSISVCEHRKFPRTKEIFLWLHDFFKWSGQIKITGSFPILFLRKREQGLCPFKCFIKQDVCLPYATSVITAKALTGGGFPPTWAHVNLCFFLGRSPAWYVNHPNRWQVIFSAFIMSPPSPCASIWSIMCKWLNRSSAMVKNIFPTGYSQGL